MNLLTPKQQQAAPKLPPMKIAQCDGYRIRRSGEIIGAWWCLDCKRGACDCVLQATDAARDALSDTSRRVEVEGHIDGEWRLLKVSYKPRLQHLLLFMPDLNDPNGSAQFASDAPTRRHYLTDQQREALVLARLQIGPTTLQRVREDLGIGHHRASRALLSLAMLGMAERRGRVWWLTEQPASAGAA